jgi:hypothetical protein
MLLILKSFVESQQDLEALSFSQREQLSIFTARKSRLGHSGTIMTGEGWF